MTIRMAALIISISFGIFLCFLGMPKTNKLYNPDPTNPFYRAVVETFCLITGCRIVPAAAVPILLSMVVAYLLVNDTRALIATIITTLLSLRIWKEIVVKSNPNIVD